MSRRNQMRAWRWPPAVWRRLPLSLAMSMVVCALAVFSLGIETSRTAAAMGNADKAGSSVPSTSAPAATPANPLISDAALSALAKPTGDYQRDRWNPLHFRPLIERARNEDCLTCHKEILERKPRTASPAGVEAANSLAWYQTLDTYEGPQMTFHARHLTSKFAREVMDLKCNFCHRGIDPRDEAVGSHFENVADIGYTLRKSVDVSKTCLRCHGSFPYQVMTGLNGPWPTVRDQFETPDDPAQRNGCLACHKDTYRTVRHQVTYLKPENIEKRAAAGSSDICYGCHGGRAWYHISYPYPRHAWPGMQDVVPETPAWAKDRPSVSDARDRKATK